MSNSEFINHPLPILVSARIRLTPDQRRELKAAYQNKLNAAVPATATGRGGLQVETSFGGNNVLTNELGMSSLVFTDLVNSRDTISITLILKLQNVLGVKIITRAELMAACENYTGYIFDNAGE